jgi:hypothetical protein
MAVAGTLRFVCLAGLENAVNHEAVTKSQIRWHDALKNDAGWPAMRRRWPRAG